MGLQRSRTLGGIRLSATYEGHTGPQAPGIGSLRRRYTQIELNACGPAKASLSATADLVAVGE